MSRSYKVYHVPTLRTVNLTCTCTASMCRGWYSSVQLYDMSPYDW